MKPQKECLFDIDDYKKGDEVYQVRLCKGESDTGEVIATFVDLYNCRLMRQITIPDGCDLILTVYEKSKGVIDMYDFWDI